MFHKNLKAIPIFGMAFYMDIMLFNTFLANCCCTQLSPDWSNRVL